MKKDGTMVLIARIDTKSSTHGALSHALKLAEALPKASLHVAAIPHRGEDTQGPQSASERASAAQKIVVGAVSERMRRGQSHDGIELGLHLLEGDASAALSKLAAGLKADMVVIAAEHSSGLREVVFGSLQRELVEEAVCPVLVVPSEDSGDVPEIEPPRVQGQGMAGIKPPTRGQPVPRNVAAHENFPLTIALDR